MHALTRALVALVVAAACSGAQIRDTTPSSPDADVMRIRLTFTALDTLNPVTAVGAGVHIANATYDKLVAVTENGLIKPYVAESWAIRPSSITFMIRRDVKCHDGTPVTPMIVADSLKYLFDPSTAAQGRPRNYGPGPWFVTSNDAAGSVTVDFGSPFSDAIFGFGAYFGGAPIICPAGLKDVGALDRSEFGSGPYLLHPDGVGPDQIVIDVDPDWTWGPFGISGRTPGRPRKIVLSMVASDPTAANLLLTGKLDVALVGGLDITRLLGDTSVTAHPGTANVTWTLQYNHRTGRPTADPVLRQAISAVVNQKDYMQAAWNGYGVGSTSLLRPGSECFDPGTAALIPETSINAARGVLRGGGYTIDANGRFVRPDGQHLSVTLLGVTGSNHGDGEDYILAQLTSLGVDTTLRKLDAATWLRESQAGNFDVNVVHSGGATPSLMPATLYGETPPRGGNYSAVDDPILDREVPAAFASVGSDRCAHYVAIQRAYLSRYHVLPLGIPQAFVFARGFDWEPLFGGPGTVGIGVDLGSVRRAR